MSIVTSACLYVDDAPPEAYERLLDPLPFDPCGQAFRAVPDGTEGGVGPIMDAIYLGGFEEVDPNDLASHVSNVLGDRSVAVLTVSMEESRDAYVYTFGGEVSVCRAQW